MQTLESEEKDNNSTGRDEDGGDGGGRRSIDILIPCWDISSESLIE